MVYLVAFAIGVVAGLRALTPLAVVSWAAHQGRLHLENTWLAFLGYAFTPYILGIAAIGELINDKRPGTPSRKVPPSFITRVLAGAISGAAIGAQEQVLVAGLFAGAAGAVAGTLGGAELRARLARAFGKDLPAALIEDLVAIVAAFVLVSQVG
jgi:uncharacterized membrane protein